MSKIAENKALEEYPMINPPYNTNIEAQVNVERAFNREGYIKGYDQAMQDFLEKAEKFFNDELYVSIADQICSVDDFTGMTNFIEQFKNYMQNE